MKIKPWLLMVVFAAFIPISTYADCIDLEERYVDQAYLRELLLTSTEDLCFFNSFASDAKIETSLEIKNPIKITGLNINVSSFGVTTALLNLANSNITLENVTLVGNKSGTGILVNGNDVTISGTSTINNFSNAVELGSTISGFNYVGERAYGIASNIVYDEKGKQCQYTVTKTIGEKEYKVCDLEKEGNTILKIAGRAPLIGGTRTNACAEGSSMAVVVYDRADIYNYVELKKCEFAPLKTIEDTEKIPMYFAEYNQTTGEVTEVYPEITENECAFVCRFDEAPLSINKGISFAYVRIDNSTGNQIEFLGDDPTLLTLSKGTDVPSVMGPIASMPEAPGADSGGVTIISEVEAGDAGGDKALETSDQIGQGASAKSGCSNVSTSDTMVPLAQLLIYLTMFSTIPAFVVIRNRKSRK